MGSKDTSDKYTHIPTDQVIKDMELLGWGVVDAKEVKARKETTVGFQKHLVVFRNNDVVIHGEDGDTVFRGTIKKRDELKGNKVYLVEYDRIFSVRYCKSPFI